LHPIVKQRQHTSTFVIMSSSQQEQQQQSANPSTVPVTLTPPPANKELPYSTEHVCLIGLGAIGISFLALHLTYTAAQTSVYDPRPDLEEHISSILPLYLPATVSVDELRGNGRLRICASLDDALAGATIVQEQGPENEAFKRETWKNVVSKVGRECRLWSSTSGISASRQLGGLDEDKGEDDRGAKWEQGLVTSARERLLIVHPFNPPHIMPLLELVPSPYTRAPEVEFAKQYFQDLGSGHRPIVIHKETKGFVANRLSFILFREACHLVNEGVVSVSELDEVMRASLGPRWAVKGVFEMYGFGGGNKGMQGFLNGIGSSIGELWDDAGDLDFKDETWKEKVVHQTNEAYGLPTPEGIRLRDKGLRAVVKCQEEMGAADN
jgi:3-hydroxyacyl-CoA dehydrogenase